MLNLNLSKYLKKILNLKIRIFQRVMVIFHKFKVIYNFKKIILHFINFLIKVCLKLFLSKILDLFSVKYKILKVL